MPKQTPQIRTIALNYRDRIFSIEYFFRPGNAETLLMIHGLGGAKENYWEAGKSDVLADHTLIAFDNPGTGNSTYYEDMPLAVDDLVNITALFIEAMNLPPYFLTGTSMGGLTTLHYLQNHGCNNIHGYINIEGNLLPEDCMFSSKVVQYDADTFAHEKFPATIADMKQNGNPGYYIIANNLQLNTNITSYYHYSFQTVAYSSTGKLLQQFLELPLPRIFIHGERNAHLSYLPTLRKHHIRIASIAGSDHFVFYDNPKDLYDTMAAVIDSID